MSNRFSDAKSYSELITQAIGAGSVCWEAVADAGVFDSDTARDIAVEAENQLSVLLAKERMAEAENRARMATWQSEARWLFTGLMLSLSEVEEAELSVEMPLGPWVLERTKTYLVEKGFEDVDDLLARMLP